ncbi:MAG: 16S rRNA (uracil(1498)-N(3))-methyltransferase [Flavobacteriaceae bacterium]
MQLFYSPNINSELQQFTFSKEESKHIVRVLRKKEGDSLAITNGKGHLYHVVVTLADQKNCIVQINSFEQIQHHNYKLHIAIAPTKMNDRMEWFLEKATEIGIDEITPIFCDNSERKVIKKERFEKIIQSAMKQSLQMQLPKLNNAISFKEFISKTHDGQLFIAHCEDQDKKTLQKEVKPLQNYTVLIGPEGDFSAKEIELALTHNFTPVSLGNTRLRTETAGIVACHTIALLNN